MKTNTFKSSKNLHHGFYYMSRTAEYSNIAEEAIAIAEKYARAEMEVASSDAFLESVISCGKNERFVLAPRLIAHHVLKIIDTTAQELCKNGFYAYVDCKAASSPGFTLVTLSVHREPDIA